MTTVRKMKYSEAILAATQDAMRACDDVFVYGIGVPGRSGIFGTTIGLQEEFGAKRAFDTPISEQALTFLGIGAANAGLRPLLVHQRLDFLILTMDQLANWAAPWRFISGGKAAMPLTIRAIVGKGWGQGPQHSKSLHSWFAHTPGLQVVTPSTPFDAKGLLTASILSNDPTIFIESRALYDMAEEVPVEPYMLRFGEGVIRRPGRDLTLVCFGSSVPMAMESAQRLAVERMSIEVLDLRTVAPLDNDLIAQSVERTGRLAVLEGGWKAFGVGAEVLAGAAERVGRPQLCPPHRISWPDSYVPTSAPLEAAFYPGLDAVTSELRSMLQGIS